MADVPFAPLSSKPLEVHNSKNEQHDLNVNWQSRRIHRVVCFWNGDSENFYVPSRHIHHVIASEIKTKSNDF